MGGQAYHPVMQDFVIQVDGSGFLGIAGPAFVKAQTAQEISIEELSGIEAHAVKSGQTHVVAENDQDCLDKCKELLTFFQIKDSSWWSQICTTNAIERRFREVRRRTRPMGVFYDRTSMERILYAVFSYENLRQVIATPFLEVTQNS